MSFIGISLAINGGGGSQGLSLPSSGLIGAWYADTYSATPRPYIPNAALASPVAPTNILFAPRRLFANATLWDAVALTVTDANATAPDGSGDASTITNAGTNWFIDPQPSGTISLPAGTYTIWISVKWNGTGSASFGLGDFNNGGLTSKTATGSWARYSQQVTYATSKTNVRPMMKSPDTTSAANFAICDFMMASGTTDPLADFTVNTNQSHMFLGPVKTPSVSGGYADLSTGNFGFIGFPSSQSLSTFTVMANASKVATGSAYSAFLSTVQSYLTFSPMTEQTSAPATFFGGGGALQTYLQTAPGLWNRLNIGAHVIGCRYDGTEISFWLDDVKLWSVVASFSAQTLKDLYVGLTNATTLFTGDKINAIALWNTSLSDATYRSAVSYLQGRALSNSSISVGSLKYVVAALGDSITAASTSFVYQGGPSLTAHTLGMNLGVSGYTITNLQTNLARYQAIVPVAQGTRKFVASVLIGANDLDGWPGATDTIAMNSYWTALSAYYDSLRSVGIKVVAITVLPQADALFNTRRNILNPLIVAGSAHYDALANFASDATMGTDTSQADHPADWADTKHPTTAGHTILAPYWYNAINSL